MPDYVMVPVPPDRVLEVYALLATAQSNEDSHEVPASEFAPAAGPATDRAVIERAYRESSEKMKGFFNYLADRPDEAISTEEVGQSIDYTWNQVAGMLGAFGRRWEHRYKEAGSWFVKGAWNYEENHMDYRMPAAAAKIIKEIRDGS